MIEARKIVTDQESGLVYSNQVTLFFEDESQPGTPLVAHIDPDGLYDILHAAIGTIPGFGQQPQASTPEEQLKLNLAKALRTAVKGLLIAFGPQILHVCFGTKDHPKPGKKDELIPWYQDMFTRIAITHLMKNDVVLTGSIAHGTVESGVLIIHQVTTRPVTTIVDGQTAAAGGDPGSPESAGHSHEDGTGGPRPPGK